MFNKKRIIVFVVFILIMFCFITFAGGTPQNQSIATRNVTFIDSYNNQNISVQKVIVGEDAEVPEDPEHKYLVFGGWYLESDRDVRVTDFTNITKDLTVIALYGSDRNSNGINDDKDAKYTVEFIDTIGNTVLSRQEVLVGMDASAPKVPVHANYEFVGWDNSYSNVRSNLTVKTVWRDSNRGNGNDNQKRRYSVRFVDGYTGSIIATQSVEEGLSASAPVAPKHEKMVFVRWDGDYTRVNSNRVVTAIYAEDINGNNVPDYLEDRYIVSYYSSIEAEGTAPKSEKSYLTGEKYKVLENTFTLDKAVFIGWKPNEKVETIVKSQEEENELGLVKPNTIQTIGTDNVLYYAVWAADENKNGVPDYVASEKYNLSISYVNKDGKEVAPKYEAKVVYDTEYEVDSPKVEGYVTKTTVVKGTMPKEDVSVKVEYLVDTNNNGEADEDEAHYNVTFKAEEKGKLEGTLEYKNVLTGSTFEQAGITVPKAVANKYYEFKKWEPAVPSEKTEVTEDLTYTAKFGPIHDVNNNGIADEEEAHYTVTFKAEGKGKLEGTLEYKNVLTGLTFEQAKIVVPKAVANQYYELKEWKPVLPSAETEVTANVTYTAKFGPIHDVNKNGIADEEETYTLTINYVYSRGGKAADSVTKNVVLDMPYEVKSPEIENYTADKLVVKGTMGKANITETVVYSPNNDKNNNKIADEEEAHYTVTFKAEGKGKLEGTLEYKKVLTGLTFEQAEIVVPKVVANKYYELKKWTPAVPSAETKVTSDLTYTAKFGPIHDVNKNGIADEEETYKLTINYEYSKGGKAADSVTKNVVLDMPYSVESPKIKNYTADKLVVEGTMGDEDITVTVVYTPNNDKNDNGKADEDEAHYTVKFKASEHGSLEGTLEYKNILTGLTFEQAGIAVPKTKAATNYEFKKWTPAVPSAETEVTGNVTYTAEFGPIHDDNNNGKADEEETYKLTINYEYSKGGKAADSVTKNVLTGEKYTVKSPEIKNYTADKLVVEGTMGDKDITVAVVYTPNNDKNNNGKADEDEEYYTVTFKAEGKGKLEGTLEYENVLTGLTFKQAEIVVPEVVANKYYELKKWTPAVPSEKTEVTADVTYTAEFGPIHDVNKNGIADEEETYKLTINYEYSKGGKAADSVTKNVVLDMPYSVESPKIKNYTADKLVVEGTMGDEDITVTVVYTPNNDENNNKIADEEEAHYTVTFKATGHGSLEGTLEYKNILTGLTFEQAGITVPKTVAEENYEFKKWTPAINETVTENVTYTASFVPSNDKNDNGKADEEEAHYTVTFKAEGKGKLEGTLEYTDVLTGLTFEQAGIIVPEVVANKYYELKEWKPVVPSAETEVTENVTYTAKFGPIHDVNNNGIADEEEAHYTVKFVAEGKGKLEGTLEYKDVLTGLTFEQAGIAVPKAVANENYKFKKWAPTVPSAKTEVTGDVTYTATFEPIHDENGNGKADEEDEHYTVTFKAEGKGKLEGTLEYTDVLTGLTFKKAGITVPKVVANKYYELKEWKPAAPSAETKVTGNVTYTAKFGPIHDVNNNDIADEEEDHYTVTFKAEGKGKLEGTLEYKNVLTGLTFKKAGITVPKVVANQYYELKEWKPTVPSAETEVTENVTYTAKFGPIHDDNNNGIADEEETHTLTINYEYSRGGKAADSVTKNVVLDMPYSVESPKIENYTADKLVVEGTMGDENITVTVVYTPNNDKNNNGIADEEEAHYTITFKAEGKGKLEGTLEYKNVLTGLTFKKAGITVPEVVANNYYELKEWTPTVPSEKTEVTGNVTYTAKFGPIHDVNNNGIADEEETYKLTINYEYSKGGKAADSVTKNVVLDMPYSVKSPEIANYTADKLVVEGTMGNKDITVKVVYTPNNDKNNNGIADEDEAHYTVKFKATGHGSLEGTLEYKNILTGLTFEQAGIAVPKTKAETNYKFNKWAPAVPSAETEVTADVTYTAEFGPIHDENDNGTADEEETHTLTINYEYSRGGKAADSVTKSVVLDMPYSVKSPEITNYTANKLVVEGTMGDKDITVKVVYTPNNDENNNGIADEEEAHYTVTFKATAHGSLEGTLEYKNILTGLTFEQAGITVPKTVAEENYKFKNWTPAVPSAETEVTGNVTYTAEFGPIHDENNNGKADEEETYTLTINYEYSRGGKAADSVTKNVLTGETYNVKSPKITYYTADKLVVEGTMGDSDITVKVVYTPNNDKNNNGVADEEETYKVVFKNWDGSVINEQSVLKGGNATLPANPTRESTAQYQYTFAGWNRSHENITANTEITATYDKTVRNYTVTFKNYYGEVIGEPQTVPYGTTTVNAPKVPNEIKVDSTTMVEFSKWSTDDYKNVVKDTEVEAIYVMRQTDSAVLFKLNGEGYIRQQDGDEDKRQIFENVNGNENGTKFTITIKDDEDGNLARVIRETKEGKEGKLAVGRDEIRKYLTEESYQKISNLNLDIYVLKYLPGDKVKWHLDCQINPDDIAVYRNGDYGLKIVSSTHTISYIEEIYTSGRRTYTNRKEVTRDEKGNYIVSGLTKNITYSSGVTYKIYYENGQSKTVYWTK